MLKSSAKKFDGDEMNMHVPQSTQTQMELKYLAAVQHHFISPSQNSPIIAPSQDNLLGVYKITADDIELTQSEATHLLSGTEAFNGILPEPAIINGKRVRWTGKQIYSVILPPITLKVGGFVVENGEVKEGQVAKKISNMIMQAIHSEYGSTETARYINDLQSVISRFLIKTGFSVGVSDMLLHPEIQQKNHERIIKAFEEEVELMRKVHLNILDDKGTGDYETVFEGEARKILKSADDEIMKQTSDILTPENNRVKFMVTSGAKGKAFNIKQMMCLLGQQDIEGSRVPLGFTDRTLPHYPRYENGLEARGFITGNFIEGLNPQEFFFHAIAGRIGLIDTAVKTAKSGYLQRKLVKMLEDLKANHDCSVRDGNNNIIEFCYGADGFDGMKLESQGTKFKFIEKDVLMNNYIITEQDGKDMKNYVLSSVIKKMMNDYPDKKWFDICQKYNKGVQRCLDLIHVDLVKLNNGEVIDSFKYPANIPKLIAKAKIIYGLEGCKVKSNMHFIDVINRLEQCLDECSINGIRNNVLMILLYDYLSPKRVLRDYHFNTDALEYVCSQIYMGFQKGIVNAGEMVGPVGAQSIGEQSTQLSVIRTEKIIIGKKNKDNKIELIHDDIGTIIDNIFETKNENDLVGYVNNDSDINNAFIRTKDDYYVLTVNRTTRKTEWQRITEFSRHPCNGGLVEVTTLTGRKITTTKSHSHLQFNNELNEITSIRGDELILGDEIPITQYFDDNTLNIENDILDNTVLTECIWDKIINIKYLPDNEDLVYDIGVEGNHTFCLSSGIFTHNTLNSVVFDTEIELFNTELNNNTSNIVKIGEYIDNLLENNKNNIKNIPENRTQYLELNDEVYIDSCDMNGIIKKCKVTAITKHLPLGDLVKIKTNSGRTVIATQQKSFLIFNKKKRELEETEGINLKVGNLIPINNNFSEHKLDYLDLSLILNKKDYIFGTDFHKAKSLYLNIKNRNNFWKKNNGNLFTLPYKRIDTFSDVVNGKSCKSTEIQKGIIYPKYCNRVVSLIPENILLDEKFGFLCGLYLAEGWTTNTFVGISNNDDVVLNKIKQWCDNMNITHHTVITESKRFKNSKSTDLKIHSVILARLFKKLFSTGSDKKYIHKLILNSNNDFVKSLIDGYFTGDGTISKKDKAVIISSASKKLLENIAYLLLRFGIFSKLSGHSVLNNNIGSKNIKYVNTLSIRNKFAKLFAKNITLTISYKQELLNVIKDYNYRNEYGKYSVYNNIILDPITSIEYIKPDDNQYVYDLTVPETLNFGLANGIMMRDTFHSTGTGAKVTAGVPRMEEILSVTSKPKTPSNILYLKPDARFDKDKAEVIKNAISQITIGEILKNDPEFYLEPTNKIENVLDEDKAFMKFYEVFAELEDNTGKDIKNNPWVIRLEFDRKEIINHNVSMSDIHIIMQNEYPDSVLMYSDDNSGKLVFRIKMPFESKQEVEDDIRLLKGKVEEIKNVIIKGVDNINDAYLNDIDDPQDKNDYICIDGKRTQGNSKPGDVYTKRKEFVITTEGSNLFEMLIRDDIDETRSYTIEPNEMWSIFGIEACKFIIQQQFYKVLSDAGAFTNARHIGLLVNKMCHDGEPYSINIYGVAKEDIGPLAKASFERPVDFFKNAALFGEVDELKGVSANIMMGQIPNAGTGSVRCYLDEEALAEGLKRKGLTKSTMSDTGMTEQELLKQFEQRTCVSEEDKIKINMTDVREDGINLDMIPTIEVE